MSVILVADEDANDARRIVDALRSAGWTAELVRDPGGVVQRGVDREEHCLLLASAALPEAASLLGAFSRRHGGPGAVALVPASLERPSAVEERADELLVKPFSDADLNRIVHRLVANTARPSRPEASRQLTSADIFGDILAEVEADARRSETSRRVERKPKRAADDDVERKLEETLSGIVPEKLRRTRTSEPAEAPPAAPPAELGSRPRGRLEQTSTAEIDRLLDQTLSSLALPAKPAKAPAAPAPPTGSEESESAASTESPARDEPEGVVFEPPPDLDLPALAASSPEGRATPAEPSVEASEVRPRPRGSGDFGDYALLDRIAFGGMAEVWRARRRGVEGFQKTVAIKKILAHLTDSPEFVSMLIDEAKLAAQLNHNNIIQIYDLGKVGDDFFIAMEYVEGKNLRSILTAARERRTPVPLGLALFITSALARALDYAHRKRDFEGREMGLVHRDVSPQNVLISYEGEIKLCDFGIVKAVSKAATTQMGALKGKLQYMSPEQAWGRPVDPRSDIFSLGTVFFEILTGVRLFAGDSEIEVLDAVRDGRIRSPRELEPEVPEKVERIVLKALARKPEDRYQTAAEMERDLEAALDTLKPTPGPKELAAFLDGLFRLPETRDAEPPGVLDEPADTALSATEPATAEVPVETSAAPIEGIAALETAVEETAATEDAGSKPANAEVSRPQGRGKILLAAVAVAVVALAAGLGYVALDSQRRAPGAEPQAETPRAPAAAPSEPTDTAVPTPAAGDTESSAVPVDLEQLVAEEVSRRREEIVQEFEAKKRRLEEELEKARQLEPASTPESSTQGSPETVPPNDEDEGNGR